MFNSPFYHAADNLAAAMDNVRALWGDDIVLGPDDYWRQLCDPSWAGPIPDKFLPYVAEYQEMAIREITKALKL